MAIVTQTDKRTGITYAYETQYFWDKEKQQSRAKRICVGKINPITNEIIPTRGRVKKKEESADNKISKRGPKTFGETKHLYYGATYLTYVVFPLVIRLIFPGASGIFIMQSRYIFAPFLGDY